MKRSFTLAAAIICSIILFSAAPQLGARDERTEIPGQAKESAPAEKKISLDSIRKYRTISVDAEEHGKKAKYTGVPLRELLSEEIPAINTMADWRELAHSEIVVEVLGDDGFPALIAATELATNESGDRFVLATKRDDQPMTESIELVCPNDQYHVRWVRNVASFRILPVAELFNRAILNSVLNN